jgi:hypothetical protein
MRKLILIAATALLVPGLALAAGKPSNPGKSQTAGANAAPKVMYVLKGTLNAYQAANGATDGSVTITVKSSNHHARALKGQQVQIPVSAATKVVGTFTLNDNGIVKVRAPKNTTAAALLAALQSAKAWQVIDQGATKD